MTHAHAIDIDARDAVEPKSDSGVYRISKDLARFSRAVCPADYNSWPRGDTGGGRRRASDGGREVKMHRGGC